MDELSRYDDKLMKLYKQEIIETVVAYERYRLALTMELNQRMKNSSTSVSGCASRAASVEPENHVCTSQQQRSQSATPQNLTDMVNGMDRLNCMQNEIQHSVDVPLKKATMACIESFDECNSVQRL